MKRDIKTKVISTMLAMSMIVPQGSPIQTYAENNDADNAVENTVSAPDLEWQECDYSYMLIDAPQKDEIAAEIEMDLGTDHSYTDEDGNEYSVNVEWECDNYDSTSTGIYTFKPTAISADTISSGDDESEESESQDDAEADIPIEDLGLEGVTVAITKNIISEMSDIGEQGFYIDEAPDKDEITWDALSYEDDETLIPVTIGEHETEVEIQSWDTDYNPDKVGEYTFTPVFDKNIYKLADDTEMSVGTVTIKKHLVSWIETSYDNLAFGTGEQMTAKDIENELGNTVMAAVDNNEETVEIPVSKWNTDYKENTVGTYNFSPVLNEDVYDVSEINEMPEAKVNIVLQTECDGITITVEADNEVIPEGAVLRVSSMDEDEYENYENAVNDPGETDNAVAAVYAFDISLENKNGDKISLPDNASVKLTFEDVLNEEIGVSGLTVYHFNDEEPDDYEVLETVKDGSSISAETGSFSPFLLMMPLADDTAEYAEEVDGKVTEIKTFTTQVISGATKQSNGDYVWTAVNEAAGHRFAFRVNYNTSGYGSMDAAVLDKTTDEKTGKVTVNNISGGIQIWVPESIIRNRKGNLDDTLEMSIISQDDIAEMTDGELADEEWAYCEISNSDGDWIVVYNRKTITAAQTGYFEIAYATDSQTFEYADYGSDNSASDPFYAIIKASGKEKESPKTPVYINTTAVITSTTKKYPTQTSKWSDSYGEYVKLNESDGDANDYYWQYWTISSDIDNVTQRYNFNLKDVIVSATASSGEKIDCDLYAYKLSGHDLVLANSAEAKNGVTINDLSYDGKRYDIVITRVRKSHLYEKNGDGSYNTNKPITSYTIKNSVTATVDPVDQVDNDTSKKSSREFSWTMPTFVSPTGHFYMRKFGDENWYGSWNYSWHNEHPYSSYDLDQLQEGTVDNISGLKYAVWAYGWPYQWTLADGAVSSDYTKYGVKKVTYEVSDSQLFPLNSDGTQDGVSRFAGTTIPEETDLKEAKALNPADYDITKISYDYYFEDADRDEDGNLYLDDYTQDFVIKRKSATKDDVLTIYTKSGSGNYVLAGTYNLGTGETDLENGSLIESVSSSIITFKAGVDGFKITASNAYYHSNFCFYPYVTIYNTDNVMSWVGTGKNVKDAVLLKNVANCKVYMTADASKSSIYEENKMSGDRLRRTQRDSQIKKKVVAASNSARKKSYNVTWRVNAYESYTTGSENNIKTMFLLQESGIFYDLLPEGSTLLDGSVQVEVPSSDSVDPTNWVTYGGNSTYLEENEYDIETIDNYKNSGRTMLIVKMKSPGLAYTVFYTTVHPWDSVKDYGRNALNPVAYETGNSKIAYGYGDDPEGSGMSSKNAAYYKGLDYLDDYTDDKGNVSDDIPKRFIYDEESHNISALTAASSGLSKRVMSSTDTNWHYDTTVTTNETYRYRLRYANTYTATAKSLVLYDTLENFYLSDDHDNIGESEWKGTLQSVDLSQMKNIVSYKEDGTTAYKNDNGSNATVSPVVYYSTVQNLDMDDEKNCDLTNTDVWKTSVSDLSAVTAVAIDCSKDSAGNDFILQPAASLAAVLYMKAPATEPSTTKANDYPETYNNVYSKLKIADTDGNYPTDENGNEIESYIHHNYTTVRYSATSDFGVYKTNENNTNEAISGITFRLRGTSYYNNEIDETKTTDKNGQILFKNIEKGTYILSEYSGTPDWLEDHTEHNVVIGGDGSVVIDGAEKNYAPLSDGSLQYVTITNKPRVHTDIAFTKHDPVSNRDLAGASFTLYGTSDYGTDVYMTEKSNTNGTVKFANIEKGTYKMKESSAPDGYIKDTTEYTVVVQENGTFSIKETSDT